MGKTFSFILAIAISVPMSAFTQTTSVVYPRIVGYIGILHPLVSFSKGTTTSNFNGSYTVGMPTGVNIWKTPKLGFSLEVVPFIRASGGQSKMNNLLIHPGLLFGLGNGFTMAGRFAFETSGRYGVTPVLNKTFKGKSINYFLAVPVPARFGNDQPVSLGIGFQFGISF
ncbi:MAG TPA: hypothetical protein VGO09_10920 [Flavisolibacter sp.]|nr:hypothetical protein [Flavisolibacter sp.]